MLICRREPALGVQERHKPDAVAAGRALPAGRGQRGGGVHVRRRRRPKRPGLLLAERRHQPTVPGLLQGHQGHEPLGVRFWSQLRGAAVSEQGPGRQGTAGRDPAR